MGKNALFLIVDIIPKNTQKINNYLFVQAVRTSIVISPVLKIINDIMFGKLTIEKWQRYEKGS
jgi:Kef-type K+ transport system membrane component KefB